MALGKQEIKSLDLAVCALRSKSHFLLLTFLPIHKPQKIFYSTYFLSVCHLFYELFGGERCVLLEAYVELSTMGLVS